MHHARLINEQLLILNDSVRPSESIFLYKENKNDLGAVSELQSYSINSHTLQTELTGFILK